MLDKVFDRLKPLVRKRNLIVHGTTYEIGFSKDEDVVAYRIGAPRGNVEDMQQFLDNRSNVLHSFTSEQVKSVSKLCNELRGEIGDVVTQVMIERAQKR